MLALIWTDRDGLSGSFAPSLPPEAGFSTSLPLFPFLQKLVVLTSPQPLLLLSRQHQQPTLTPKGWLGLGAGDWGLAWVQQLQTGNHSSGANWGKGAANQAPVSLKSHRKCSMFRCPNPIPSLTRFSHNRIVTSVFCPFPKKAHIQAKLAGK